ncbi:MAG: hypothetical protein ABSD48_19165 [Armatimonadota bacterium]
MKRVRGRYNGSAVILEEKVDIPADTEVVVLIPEARDGRLNELLDELNRLPAGETMALDEIVALVHEVRAAGDATT